MKLAVLADTHLPRGKRRLPDECLRRLAAADLILHAGDFVRMSVLQELEELAPVEAVYGNNDEPDLLRALPRTRVVEVEGVRIGMVHEGGRTAGRRERLARRFADCHAVVYAHTHIPEVARAEGMWILNPGSPTERRGAPARSMLEVRAADGRLRCKLVTLSP